MTHKTVLLVEDEVFVAMDFQMTLEDEGWTVAGPFPSTEEALDYLADNTPSCAILDVRLTDGDVFRSLIACGKPMFLSSFIPVTPMERH